MSLAKAVAKDDATLAVDMTPKLRGAAEGHRPAGRRLDFGYYLTDEPTAEPTAVPTREPTAEPTGKPTAAPTAEPSAEPTKVPTAEPSSKPTAEPKRRGRLVHAQRGKKDRQPRRSFFTKRGEKPVLRMRVSLPTSTGPCTSKLFIAHPPLSRATRAEAPLRSRGTRTHLV